MNAAIAALFALTQQLLDAGGPPATEVEKITGRKLTVIRKADRIFTNYVLKETKGPFTRLELRVPKSMGGVSYVIHLRDKPRREDI
jgi:hypothetical protein